MEAVKHMLSCVLTVLHCSYEGLLQNFHLFVLLKNICMYLFGCAGSWLQHMGPSIFTAACGSLFPAFILSVVACGIQFPDQGSNPGPFVLGAQSVSHWTTKKFLFALFTIKFFFCFDIESLFPVNWSLPN